MHIPSAPRLAAAFALVAFALAPWGSRCGLGGDATGLAAAPTVCADARRAADGRLLVLDEAGGTVALIDPATLRVDTTVVVGSAPQDIVIAADGTLAFI